ncbi:MAG: hypothetical protein LBQ76_01000 [Candidatus Fibromonas sp.]|jgi:hypothetical protein|nr:hypothetical protein [Candidatus Fibromonas sp.]
MEQSASDTLYYVWFIVIIAILTILFVAKLKFDKNFEKREERRRLLSYSKARLAPNEEGQSRTLKIKRIK